MGILPHLPKPSALMKMELPRPSSDTLSGLLDINVRHMRTTPQATRPSQSAPSQGSTFIIWELKTDFLFLLCYMKLFCCIQNFKKRSVCLHFLRSGGNWMNPDFFFFFNPYRRESLLDVSFFNFQLFFAEFWYRHGQDLQMKHHHAWIYRHKVLNTGN